MTDKGREYFAEKIRAAVALSPPKSMEDLHAAMIELAAEGFGKVEDHISLTVSLDGSQVAVSIVPKTRLGLAMTEELKQQFANKGILP